MTAPATKKAALWRGLMAKAGDDLIDGAASVSVEQAERELAAAGFDVAAERRKAAAVLRRIERGR